MPTIPEYFSESSTSLVGSRRAGAESFGGGQGLIDLGKAVASTSEAFQQLKQKKEERDATAYVLEQSAKLQLDSMKRLQQMKVEDGDINTFTQRFQDEFDTQAKTVQDGAPNQLAKDSIQKQINQIKLSLSEQAFGFQANETIAQHKTSANNAADALANTIYIHPEGFDQYKQQGAAIVSNAARFMTESESTAFRADVADKLAQSKIRAEMEVNPYQAEKLLTSDEFVNSLGHNSFVSLENAINSRKESLKEAAAKAQDRQMKLFQDDPAMLAIENGASPDDPESIIMNQRINRSDGSFIPVQPDNLSVIPKQQASFISNNLTGINNPDILVTNLKQLEKQYGKYYPIAMRDLRKNGLSADAAFISYMDTTADKHIIDASFAINKAGVKEITDLAKARAAANNDKFADLDIAVTNNISDMTDVMLAEGIPVSEVNNVRTRASNIASYFYQRSGDMKTAAAQATDWLNSKYNLGKINGNKFRAPADYDITKIEEGLGAVLKNLKPEDYTTVSAEGSGSYGLENLKERGSFILDDEGTGFYLVDEFGMPVRGKDKVNPYHVKITDIFQAGQEEINRKLDASAKQNAEFLKETP